MLSPILEVSREALDQLLLSAEKEFDGSCIYINGPIVESLILPVKENVKALANRNGRAKLCVFLNTNGGDVNTTERLVNIFRHHFRRVEFVIPDHAYSAGTLLCMSGDRIWMDYSSVLGPIDPQVFSKENKMYVPAAGYVGKIQDLLRKAQNDTISEAEFLILKDFDLAELSLYEQAIDLTVELLKKWLVEYKFRDWKTHKSSGTKVTKKEKDARAEMIAKALGDNGKWKTHGRPLNIKALTALKLRIDDYGIEENKADIVSKLHSMAVDFMGLSKTEGIVLIRR